SRVSFTDSLSANGCSLPSKTKQNGRRPPLPPPVDSCSAARLRLCRQRTHEDYSLGGSAGAFAFQSALAFFRAYVHLDLLRLGFGLLGQRDLQHSLVVVS